MRRLLLIIVAMVTSLAYNAYAQMDQPLPNDPAVIKGKLDNGLTYYIMKNALPAQRAEFYLATNVGALQETPDQDGLAHFLEHMCFNGTKNFPDKGILDYLQSIGASFGGNINASTGVEQTVYMLNNIPLIRPTVIDTCILIMHDYSHFVNCDPKEIDKERGVILEEKRSRNTASWRMREAAGKYLYGDTKYATTTVIGSEENLKTFKPESLTNFYHTWYRPDMQALIVVGDVDPAYVESKIKEIFSDIPAAVNPKQKDVIKIPDNKEPLIGIITDPEAVSTSVSVYWKSEPLPEKYNNTMIGEIDDLVSNIVSSVMNERFQDIMASADAPFTSASLGTGNICETSRVVAGDLNVHEGEAIKGFKTFLTEIEKMKKFGFTDDEIQRAKDNILSHYEDEAKKEDTRTSPELVYPLINNFFDNYAYMKPSEEYELVKQLFAIIPSQAINQTVAQMIPDSNMIVIYNAPEKEGLTHPTAEDFKQAISEVLASEIKPNAIEKIDSTFIDPSTLKGSAIKSRTEGAYGSTVVELKNGLKAIFRPSSDEKNKIVFELFKHGGESLIPTADLASFDSNVWAAFRNYSGIAGFSGTVTGKMLAGKNVSVNPYISTLRHGLNGYAAPKDIETALQLAYLYFAEPRFDQAEFDQAISQLKAIVPNYVQQPNYQLSKAINKVIYGDNPRTRLISEEILEQANLATIEKDYKMLFNDAAGATVIFCGDFNTDELLPLVEKYLGSIKKGRKPLKWTDPKTDYLPGTVVEDFTVAMQTPKVTVVEFFNAPLKEYTVKEDIALSAASYILDMRYTKSLREEEGGTYGASTYGSVSSILPHVEASFQISFETNPESADKLVKLSHEGLDSLANIGPTKDEFDMAVKNLDKNLHESRIKNGWWQTSLRYIELYGIDYDKDYEEAIKALKPEDVSAILKTTLASKSAKTIIMRPEEASDKE